MIVNIPIQPIPNQQLNVVLNGQSCTINLYQRDLSAQDYTLSYLYVNYVPSAPDSKPVIDILELQVSANNVQPLEVAELDQPTGISAQVFCDLYVNSNAIYTGMPVIYGSFINQNASPDFVGYLFINTSSGQKPEYTEFGDTALLYYTDGDLSS